MPKFLVGAVVFGALTLYAHDLSTTVGEGLGPLVEISTGCFGLVAAISAIGFAGSTCAFMLSSVVYHPVEKCYRVGEILLASKPLQLTRSFLAHVDAHRGGRYCRSFPDFRSTLLKVVASGAAGEIIGAIIRYIVAEFWNDES